MKLPELLAALSARSELRFLLIGGHAVIGHGYARTTFDVDLLACRDELSRWVSALQGVGYRLENQAEWFAQFSSPADGEALDLMLVNAKTFEGLWQGAKAVELNGRPVKIPSLDHLLALKLHVLKQNLLHRGVKDLDDIIRLVLANQLPIENEYYRQLFERYGTSEIYQRVLKAAGRP